MTNLQGRLRRVPVVCRAKMPGHLLDAAKTPKERAARIAALDRLARLDEHGRRILPGPETV